MTEKRENLITYTIVIITIIGCIFLLRFLIQRMDRGIAADRQKQEIRIEECKSKTPDVEWCYRQFYKPNY